MSDEVSESISDLKLQQDYQLLQRLSIYKLQNRGEILTISQRSFGKWPKSDLYMGDLGRKKAAEATRRQCSQRNYNSVLIFPISHVSMYHYSQSYTVVRKYWLDRPAISFLCLFLLWNLLKTQNSISSPQNVKTCQIMETVDTRQN